MKTLTFKSTKGGKFNITLPKNYKKIKLPLFKKWVSALESGKYRQCTGTLCSINNKKLTYCCLGVLSKIQGRLKKDNDSLFKDGLSHDILDDNNPCEPVLYQNGSFPDDVTVEKKDEYGILFVKECLSECNDVLQLSFKDIAKIIKTLYKA